MLSSVVAYGAAATTLVVADMIWLGIMASRFYRPTLGDVALPGVNLPPAIAFYAVYPVGLVLFAVAPALKSGSLSSAALQGALFGFFTFATYDLTNYATIRNWTLSLTLVDIAWGTCLGAAAAVVAWLVVTKFLAHWCPRKVIRGAISLVSRIAMSNGPTFRIAIVGTGISGLSAAWLLGRRHDITVYERAGRAGGHANTVVVPVAGRPVAVDTGFIVFNRRAYPGLGALFDWLDVPTQPSEMSFSVSIDDGALEYSGSGLAGLLGQRRNLVRPRFWSMLADTMRFYRAASRDAGLLEDETISLGAYLERGRYGKAFREDHLLPMAGAIWSAAPAEMLSYPAAAFIRFHANHGLLQVRDRPRWETVVGGSRTYVERLTESFADRIRLNVAVTAVRRQHDRVVIQDSTGHSESFDHVVMACHADQALAALSDPSAEEMSLLGAFRYSRNHAVLHGDESLMPRRRSVWSSWNYIGRRNVQARSVCVTYWMNRLQGLASDRPLFVTLNPPRPPRAGTVLHCEDYDHPLFDADALRAQRRLRLLQGQRNTWFCGAHFGSGFHEDGLQAGLAVAAELGGVRPPWHPQGTAAPTMASLPA